MAQQKSAVSSSLSCLLELFGFVLRYQKLSRKIFTQTKKLHHKLVPLLHYKALLVVKTFVIVHNPFHSKKEDRRVKKND